tara:strand:- start:1503 stop:3311 length:1809 start_codon:yes stop_codon:yes gene_type:complete
MLQRRSVRRIEPTTFECVGCNQSIGVTKFVQPFQRGVPAQTPADLLASEVASPWAIPVNEFTRTNCIVTRHHEYLDCPRRNKLAKVWCGNCFLNVGNLQCGSKTSGEPLYHFLKKNNVGFRPASQPDATLRHANRSGVDWSRMGDSGLYDVEFDHAFGNWYAAYTGVGAGLAAKTPLTEFLQERGVSLAPPVPTPALPAFPALQQPTVDEIVAFVASSEAGGAGGADVDAVSEASVYTLPPDDDDDAEAEAEMQRRLDELSPMRLQSTPDRLAPELPPGFRTANYQEPPLVDFGETIPSRTPSPPKRALTPPRPPPPRTLPSPATATLKMSHLLPGAPTHAVIHWDVENIAVPRGASVIETAKRISYAVREALDVNIEGYFAYLNTHKTPAATLEALAHAGVDCIDCSAKGKREQVDFRIIVRALLSRTNEAVVIVSGDGDMAYTLSVLDHSGRATAIVYDKHNTQSVSTALLETARCAIPVAISSEKSPAPSVAATSVSSASSSVDAPTTMPSAALQDLLAGCDDAQRALLLAVDRAPEARDGGWKTGPTVGGFFHKIRGLRTNAFKPAKVALQTKKLVAVHEHGDFLKLTPAATIVVAHL